MMPFRRRRQAGGPTRRDIDRGRKKADGERSAGSRRRGGDQLQRARAGSRAALARAQARIERSGPPLQRAARSGLGALADGLQTIGKLILGGLAEIGAVWLRIAEVLGEALLRAWRAVWPPLLAALHATRRGIAVAERAVTPRRAVAVVVLGAAGLLAASQFVDYRGVEIGSPAYEDVGAVAPAPQTDRETAGSVHAYAMVPVAVLVAIAVLLAMRGRWRAARIIPLLGALVIAVSALHDARKGLEEGQAGLAYEGARAVLIEGFWAQTASAAVLVVTGLLLARYARAGERAARPASSRRRTPERGKRRRRLRIAGVRA